MEPVTEFRPFSIESCKKNININHVPMKNYLNFAEKNKQYTSLNKYFLDNERTYNSFVNEKMDKIIQLKNSKIRQRVSYKYKTMVIEKVHSYLNLTSDLPSYPTPKVDKHDNNLNHTTITNNISNQIIITQTSHHETCPHLEKKSLPRSPVNQKSKADIKQDQLPNVIRNLSTNNTIVDLLLKTESHTNKVTLLRLIY